MRTSKESASPLGALRREKQKSIDKVLGNSEVKKSKTLLLSATNEDVDMLRALGLDHHIKKAEEVTYETRRLEIFETKYEEEVFSGLQLRTLCETYHLKVRKLEYYEGRVDRRVIDAVKKFCAAYKNEVDIKEIKSKLFILAPVGDFDEDKKVYFKQDPMVFYRAEEGGHYSEAHEKDTFVLVHRWGDNFSSWRKFLFLFNSQHDSTYDIVPAMWTWIGIWSCIILSFIGIAIGLYSIVFGGLAMLGLSISRPIFAKNRNIYIKRKWNKQT